MQNSSFLLTTHTSKLNRLHGPDDIHCLFVCESHDDLSQMVQKRCRNGTQNPAAIEIRSDSQFMSFMSGPVSVPPLPSPGLEYSLISVFHNMR